MSARRPPRRRLARGTALALLAGTALAASSVLPTPVQATVTAARAKRSYHPRPGLTLTAVRYADGPVQVRTLEFTPKVSSSGFTVEPGINGPVITSHATPSSIAASLGAIAAVRRNRRRPGARSCMGKHLRGSSCTRGSGR